MLCKVLDSLAAQAIELKSKIEKGQTLPSWAEYKVYKAGDSIKSAMSSTYTMKREMPVTIAIQKIASRRHVVMDKLNPFSKTKKLKDYAKVEAKRHSHSRSQKPAFRPGGKKEYEFLTNVTKENQDMAAGDYFKRKQDLKEMKPGTTRKRAVKAIKNLPSELKESLIMARMF